MTQGPGPTPEEQQGPVVRDRRRVDPETGELRDRGPAAAPSAPAAEERQTSAQPDAETEVPPATGTEAELQQQLGERLADLQRLQAEYVNYKRRVERDRQLTRDVAVAGVLTELLPVLDDIGRAREHGELEGGFKAVAEALEATLGKIGLERYGEVGEPFDPRIHEALMHGYSDEVTEPTASTILQPGYRYAERVLRPARVAVSEPTEALPPSAGATGEQQAGGERESGPADDASDDSAKA